MSRSAPRPPQIYSVTDQGVVKTIESWSVTIPRHDNTGQPFPDHVIDDILTDISLRFPGFTLVDCLGYWTNENRIYRDQNLEVIIDTLASDEHASTQFFLHLKDELRVKSHQDKIYVTKQQTKQELLSLDEFFHESGIELGNKDTDEKRRIAEKTVENWDFIIQRLQYKTTVLSRDRQRNKIIWERRLCGILLSSEWDDTLPEFMRLIAADRLDELAEVLSTEQSGPVCVVGDYEYQGYVLEKFQYRPLTHIDAERFARPGFRFFSPDGEPLTCSEFIERLVAHVAVNCAVLREEGFTMDEIEVTVGRDGSLQRTTRTRGDILFHTPGIIPTDEIVEEIRRALRSVLDQYERSDLDPIALLQAKVRNRFTIKRAIVRKTLRKDVAAESRERNDRKV